MSTNFYWHVPGTEMKQPMPAKLPDGREVVVTLIPTIRLPGGEAIDLHIGKRSAAGAYCWDCRLTLCRDGEARIHFQNSGFHKSCPRCHKQPPKPSWEQGNGAAVELGFAKPNKQRPSGVTYVSSFSWAQDPKSVLAACKNNYTACVEDEYGKVYSGQEFVAMLEFQCPIQSTDSVGQRFT